MISDFNAVISGIDIAMERLEAYDKALGDVRARVAFDLRSLLDRVMDAHTRCARDLEVAEDALVQAQQRSQDPEEAVADEDQEALRDQADRLRCRMAELDELASDCLGCGQQLMQDWNTAASACAGLSHDGALAMGQYIHDLNLAVGIGVYGVSDGTYLCVIDSRAYPQTAEHIRIAQRLGMPRVLTVDRAGADARRRASLKHTPARPEYDRDEYPMAMTAEGGAGADVFYITGGDNRGAGSFIRHQLRSVPDGARVRFRIV